ncbi:MAG TPA: winged helix-turn-helix domain-containing protein [Rhizomicrobium sp.]|nr:winged helix-turn-helix domain-containing protein [Rhizomicrobium sp.]
MNYASRTMSVALAISLAEEKEFRLGTLFVRPSTREIVFNGRSEIVEPRVMQALVVLAQADGAVVSRDRLIERCWGGRIVGDDAINNCVAKIRALAALTTEPAFEVETVPRVGYRLITAQPDDNTAQPIFARTPVESAGSSTVDGSPSRRTSDLRKITLLAALALVVVAAAVALWSTGWIGSRHNSQLLPLPSQTTVAVLPFTPLYPDRNASVYADEISSDVADTLGQTDLNVISPALSFQFRGDAKARAARALHADILVNGDIRRESNSFDVAIRIEDVASGLVLLSKNITAPAAQATDLPNRVATFIAGALGWDVSIRALNSGKRWDPRIRTGVLRALFQCPHRQDPFCSYEIGRKLVAAAPGNAIAQTILAIETTNILDSLPQWERKTVAAKARAAAWTAIRLDPHFGEPYIALSELSPDRAAKESYLRRGLSADPDSWSVSGYLSALLYSSGRVDEGLMVIQKVSAQYKFEDSSSTNQIWPLLALGRTRRAVEIGQRARRLWPDTWLFVLMLFDAAAFGGDTASAEAMLHDPATGPILLSRGDPPTIAHLVQALRSRRARDANVFSHDCATDSREFFRNHFCLVGLTMLGRVDEAFRLPPEESTEHVLFWPQTAPMRADPRFFGLAKKLGLLAYWKAVHAQPDFCATEHAPVCQALAPNHK